MKQISKILTHRIHVIINDTSRLSPSIKNSKLPPISIISPKIWECKERPRHFPVNKHDGLRPGLKTKIMKKILKNTYINIVINEAAK